MQKIWIAVAVAVVRILAQRLIEYLQEDDEPEPRHWGEE